MAMSSYFFQRHKKLKWLIIIVVIMIFALTVAFSLFIRKQVVEALENIPELMDNLFDSEGFDYESLNTEDIIEAKKYRLELIESVIEEMKADKYGYSSNALNNYDNLEKQTKVTGNNIIITKNNELLEQINIHINLSIEKNKYLEGVKDNYDILINDNLITSVKIRTYDDYTIIDGAIPGEYNESVLFYYNMLGDDGILVPGIIHIMIEE